MDPFPVHRNPASRMGSIDFNNLRFGCYFSDHVFQMTYSNKAWHTPEIVPYGPLNLEPSNLTLHYGQAIFEGLKAYRHANDVISIFRPDRYMDRMVNSCRRLCIPDPPKDIVLEGLKQVVELDKEFVPHEHGHSLYLRPFVFATDNALGVQESKTYKLMIITSPVAAYYPEGIKPVKLDVPPEYIRAAAGGTGTAKTPANYAASLLPAKKAREAGYTQVLWLDAQEHRYIEEVGTMNIFFVIGDEVITPPLTSGTILGGITRMTVLELLREWNYKVSERRLTIDDVLAAQAAGELKEVFGTGTAAVISPVGEIHYKNETLTINNFSIGPIGQRLYDEIDGIQYGLRE
ncbi:MAG: branched-chain amino acid aminotransferase, partial [Candidatus Cloacimonetes bacterium]|nr:branched-chain amino acid aminotransferase [Candidatus Cloacimonadota bacterium]